MQVLNLVRGRLKKRLPSLVGADPNFIFFALQISAPDLLLLASIGWSELPTLYPLWKTFDWASPKYLIFQKKHSFPQCQIALWASQRKVVGIGYGELAKSSADTPPECW